MDEVIRVAPSPIFLISYFNGAQVEMCTDVNEARARCGQVRSMFQRGMYENNPNPTIFQLTQVS